MDILCLCCTHKTVPVIPNPELPAGGGSKITSVSGRWHTLDRHHAKIMHALVHVSSQQFSEPGANSVWILQMPNLKIRLNTLGSITCLEAAEVEFEPRWSVSGTHPHAILYSNR